MSAATSARKAGVAAPPVVGPAKTVLAVCVFSAKVKLGVVVGLAIVMSSSEARLLVVTFVTVPLPPPPPPV